MTGKARTLEWVAPRVKSARVLPLVHFTVAEWQASRGRVLGMVEERLGPGALIVRSSASGEDGAETSAAGQFTSIPDVCGRAALEQAIDVVIASYGDGRSDHRVLVQPFLEGTIASGVAFTRDPASGAPYLVVNYQIGDDTAAVTGGRADDLRTFYCWKQRPPEGGDHVRGGEDVRSVRLQPDEDAALLDRVIALASELEALFEHDALDFEFACTGDGSLVLFQVRPLVLRNEPDVSAEDQTRALSLIADKVARAQKPAPHLHGRRTVFGVMPDWNPAEIIGVRPRPLALSLYRELVTDAIWAYQRSNYGYKDLRSFPLLVDFHGLPYIDVRVSFNSFVPADIPAELAERLVDAYIDRLTRMPALHDKVEFEIVLSCYSFDLPARLARLPRDTFSDADRTAIADSLRRLTNRIINNRDGLWRTDAARIETLERRHAEVMAADLDDVSRIYWLLEDCKRYGTLPFAGLARAAFIATQMLQSLVRVGVMTPDELSRFMAGVDSISAGMMRDLRRLPRAAFLARYGHLRPGTYDVLSPRYDEAPDHYFDWSAPVAEAAPAPEPFALSLKQMREIERLLLEHGLEHGAIGLFDFLEAAIRGREHAKFVFTRSLSDALALFARIGRGHGFSAADMSYAHVGCIQRLYAGSDDPAGVLAESIAEGRRRYRMTRHLLLPPLVTAPEQVWSFHQLATQPNFVTQKETTGAVCGAHMDASLEGTIVLLPNADPGFDWIFSRNIAGFVTAYGGVNSHMAVRAGELGLPAVIGAGEPLYAKWSRARMLRLDCLNRQVQVVQ
jgi:hypothetical protein